MSAAAVIPITRAYIVAIKRIVVELWLTLNKLLSWHDRLLDEWKQLFPEEWHTFPFSRSVSSLYFDEWLKVTLMLALTSTLIWFS